MGTTFTDQALALKPELVARRRDFHRHPELGFEEVRTAGIVAAELARLGIEVQTGIGKTGVVGLLEGAQDGPTVLVRCDMDALPIHEANATDYVSQSPGKMHACGHDGHTSIGLAVAQLLSAQRESMRGRVKFVFQPAEEGGKGAAAMIADGVLENPRPDVSLGLHLWNDMPVGHIAVMPGPTMAAADIWSCEISGHGGHGAAPHQTRDPIVAAAQIVSAIQTIVSRNVSPLDTAVVSVGSIHGGDAFNVIPPTVRLEGTIRAFKRETQEMVYRRLRELCAGIANALQCEATLDIQVMTPAVSNDPDVCALVREAAISVVGTDNLRDDQRTMGSEDMARLMEDVPGCYFFVGSANADKGLNYPHHNPRFDVDEDALPIGAAVLAGAVARYVLPD
jgi:amidohydrolase